MERGKTAKAIPSEKEIHEPWSLIPKKELRKSTKEEFIKIILFLERHSDNFLCIQTTLDTVRLQLRIRKILVALKLHCSESN